MLNHPENSPSERGQHGSFLMNGLPVEAVNPYLMTEIDQQAFFPEDTLAVLMRIKQALHQ